MAIDIFNRAHRIRTSRGGSNRLIEKVKSRSARLVRFFRRAYLAPVLSNAEKIITANLADVLNLKAAKNPYKFDAKEISKVAAHRAMMRVIAQTYANAIEVSGPSRDSLIGLANVRNDLAEYDAAQAHIERLLDLAVEAKRMPLTSVVFMMTDKCNLRCKHCFIFNEKVFHPVARKDELTADQYTTIFKSLRCTEPGFRIHITGGGEVFARTDFEHIIKQLALLKLPNHISFQTNGHFPERLRAMLEDPDILECVDLIQFSLDGLEETHNRVRGNGNFAKLIQSMKIANEFEIETSAITTILPDNIDSLDKVRDLAKSVGVANHRFQMFFEEAKIALSDLSRASDFITERDRSLVYHDIRAPGKGCLAGIRTCIVRPNGVVETCRESYSGNVPPMIITDLRQHDLDLPRALSSPEAIAAMRRVKECLGCAAFCDR